MCISIETWWDETVMNAFLLYDAGAKLMTITIERKLIQLLKPAGMLTPTANQWNQTALPYLCSLCSSCLWGPMRSNTVYSYWGSHSTTISSLMLLCYCNFISIAVICSMEVYREILILSPVAVWWLVCTTMIWVPDKCTYRSVVDM